MQSKAELKSIYEQFKKSGMKLDMSRGKPSKEQLDKIEPLLTEVTKCTQCVSENGVDCRNYGGLDGIPEAKRIFAGILGIPCENIIVGGNSSLSMMFDLISTAYSTGIRGCEPWCRQEAKFLCPSPGYDRHFAVTEYFGIKLIQIDMTPDGPDMDQVEEYIKDPSVKGIWNVPKYSNPTGITYSDETVRRFAALKPAAKDFCIIWDNAYCIHDLTDEPDKLADIFAYAKDFGGEDMIYEFASTSKITFSGSGIACIAASKKNIAEILNYMKVRTICNDKVNMLRHAKLLDSEEKIRGVMMGHREVISPKFKLCLDCFDEKLKDIEGVSWTKPNGGYFITLYVPDGKAKRIVSLAKEAGLILTSAGAGFPYEKDPRDRVIRIAPTYPGEAELEKALELLCVCIGIAVTE